MTRMPQNRFRLRLAPWLLRLTVVASVPVLSACGHPTVILQTDPTVIAQRAIQVVKVLDVVVTGAMAARDAGWISPQVCRTVELAIQKSLPVIKAAPDGGRALAVATLKDAAGTVGLNAQVSAYLTWGQTAIRALP